ncbi:MAG: hypothetical protein JO080_00125 [Mucilaginibacter sp.]|nr:hypothetical protein [Mucilaginibacter sp.]
MNFRNVIQLLFYADKWNIGFINQSATDLIKSRELNKISWLEEESIGFSADPFILVANDTTYIYYEYMSFWHGRGRIYQVKNFDFATRKEVKGLPGKFHFSYPYIFSDNSETYCIPETAEANEVSLYTIKIGDTSWFKKKRVILSGVPYVDSSVVKFNGKYWLFTSVKDISDRFYIFYADSLDEEFFPHYLNPICCSPQFARAAGQLFPDQGILYRPTQNPISGYGGSIVISKITMLTERAFSSEVFMEILPEKPYKSGIHNISFAHNLIVVDGKKKVYSTLMLPKKLVREFKTFMAKFSIRHKYKLTTGFITK